MIKLQGVADKIARKHGTCSRNYVSEVLHSSKAPKAVKAKAIVSEFQKLLPILKDDE